MYMYILYVCMCAGGGPLNMLSPLLACIANRSLSTKSSPYPRLCDQSVRSMTVARTRADDVSAVSPCQLLVSVVGTTLTCTCVFTWAGIVSFFVLYGVCCRLMAFACVCCRLLARACVCVHVLACACVCLRLRAFAVVCGICQYVDLVCSRLISVCPRFIIC